MPCLQAHSVEVAGGGWPLITIAMPLDPGVWLCHGGVLFEDWIPHEYYSYAENLRGVCTYVLEFFLLGV